MVNGSPTIFFQRSKGLRQGDPFSPYLFVIAMEVFSCLLKRAERRLFVWVEGERQWCWDYSTPYEEKEGGLGCDVPFYNEQSPLVQVELAFCL